MAEPHAGAPPRQHQTRGSKHAPHHTRPKLAKLPPTAKVHKRPLLRPAIPSPYAGASQQKTVYVSARTPFLAAVKRVEKLLDQADKRLIQAATTLAKQKGQSRKRKRGHEDEVMDIAGEVERLKANQRKNGPDSGRSANGNGAGDGEEEGAGEEVVMKGTGKAISKVLEMALWFQQREDRFTVRLKTGSVGCIDDIEMPDVESSLEEAAERRQGDEQASAGADERADQSMEVDQSVPDDVSPEVVKQNQSQLEQQVGTGLDEHVPETRIRYTSVLEVYVSLR